MEVEEKLKRVPIFIKIDKYRDLIDKINFIQLESIKLKNYLEVAEKIKELEKNIVSKEKESLEKIIENIKEVSEMILGKREEKKEIEELKSKLDEVKTSLEEVSKKLEEKKTEEVEIEAINHSEESVEESVIKEYKPQ
ncbi:MAG: hypothetical protein QXS69_03505 [Candidatus Aenigmatarchaeota archaeon]